MKSLSLKFALAGFLCGAIGDALNHVALFFNDFLMPVKVAKCTNDAMGDSHQCMVAATHFKLLCDIIPVSHTIYSVGDLGIFLGLMIFTPALAIYLYSAAKNLRFWYHI